MTAAVGHVNRPWPIVLLGQPVLHTPAATVTAFDASLHDLVEQLFRSMAAAPGAGLAAPQVGVGLRVFVFDCGPGQRGHLVNPTLERVGTQLQDGEEGCLSLPGLAYDTARAEHVVAHGADVDGAPVSVEGAGYLARCLQHETDHLDGRLYLDRLGGRTLRRARRDIAGAAWRGDAVRELG